ncbi:hypothetical protein HY250_00765 [Candidatus Azambacteria bacterium]|nr:hypothetical protein [Candidatus Azambacteria bacterium]
MYNKRHTQYNKGFAAMVSVLAIMALGLILGSGFLYSIIINTRALQSEVDSLQGFYASESGVEDAIHRVRDNLNVVSPSVLVVGSATATTTVSTAGNVKTVAAEGGKNNAIRKSQTTLTLSTTQADFFYGVQVGEGGVEMDQNSQITGSIYSNGNVEGASGARVTGDLWVAGGANPTLDANWTVQNGDFSFGNTAGSVVTTVDSGGDTGDYTALALAMDDTARISYYDDSNKDLKLAQCANADCTTKVLTAADTTGDVGYRYSSVALGSDGFARISYYDNTNKDLKFARCTNASCSTKVLAAVDTTNDVGQFSSLTLGSDGYARIAYYSVSAGDLKYVRCTNADCTTRVITTVDSSGDVGKYTSVALGTNGYARMSYKDETNDDVKFVRCLDDDCTSKNITTVDASGNLGEYQTSLALNGSNFGFISYQDNSNDDLKFARCTNDDCTAKNITVVDSSGNQGKYSSLKLGSDGFARISYYDASNGAVKFARCTNADCTAKNINSVDTAGNIGLYTSLALGSDGFARISYRDDDNRDLKFIRCVDADCTPPQSRLDAAQSFQLATSTASAVRRVSLYIKKVGTPSDITVRIMKDDGGKPGDGGGDVLATGTLSAAAVTANYGWVDVSFTTNPTLNPATTYWIMTDTSLDNNNYWAWGLDSAGGYAQGTAKHSTDWTGGAWTDITGDLDFRVWVGGSDTSVTDVIVNGDVHAHSIATSSVCGNAYYQSIDASSLNFLNAPTTPTCPTPLTNGIAYPGSTDPPVSGMPISQGNIDQWKADATAGGVITGNYTVSSNVSLGPKEITGNLVMTSNNKTLTVTGTLWVHGTIDVSNGSTIRCDASFGANSCVIVADGWVHVSNNGTFSGSGTAGSFLMLLTTLACTGVPGVGCGHHDGAVDVHNQATGVIFYATNGMINLHNGVNITEATAYKLRLDNTATITYDQGLANASFSSGPSAGWLISDWKEVP